MNIKAEKHVIVKKHSNALQNVAPHIITPTSTATKTLVSYDYFLLLQNSSASLFEFPLVGKPLLQVQQGGWWMGLEGRGTSRSQIHGMVRLVLVRGSLGLARASCDGGATQNCFYSLARGFAGGCWHPPGLRYPSVFLGVFLQTCLPWR